MNDTPNDANNGPAPIPSAPAANEIADKIIKEMTTSPPAQESQVQMDLGAIPGFVVMQFRPAATNIRFTSQGAVSLAIALLQNSIAAAAPPAPLIEPYNPGQIIPAR